jgi:hypothetical protein
MACVVPAIPRFVSHWAQTIVNVDYQFASKEEFIGSDWGPFAPASGHNQPEMASRRTMSGVGSIAGSEKARPSWTTGGHFRRAIRSTWIGSVSSLTASLPIHHHPTASRLRRAGQEERQGQGAGGGVT